MMWPPKLLPNVLKKVKIVCFDQDDKTLLELTHQGVESFAAGGPDFAKENFNEGWNHFVNKALKEYLKPSLKSKSVASAK